jgi:hypothetical protein
VSEKCERATRELCGSGNRSETRHERQACHVRGALLGLVATSMVAAAEAERLVATMVLGVAVGYPTAGLAHSRRKRLTRGGGRAAVVVLGVAEQSCRKAGGGPTVLTPSETAGEVVATR